MGEAKWNLTRGRLGVLRSAQGQAGIVSMPHMTGFEAVSWKRNAEALCLHGLLEANAHGDWYITEKGRAALATDHAPDTPSMKEKA